MQATPQIQYVAVLADDQAAASMLVTFDPKNQKLVLQRVGGFQEGDDKSLQLWALPPAGGPRSLGVLGQDKLLTLTAAEQEVKQVPTLAISLETQGWRAQRRGRHRAGAVQGRTHPAHAVKKSGACVNPAGWAARTR